MFAVFFNFYGWSIKYGRKIKGGGGGGGEGASPKRPDEQDGSTRAQQLSGAAIGRRHGCLSG